MKRQQLLEAIGSTEPSSFNEVCRALGDNCPEKGDKMEWAALFSGLDEAERDGLVDVGRMNGKIETVILTESGVAALKQLQSEDR